MQLRASVTRMCAARPVSVMWVLVTSLPLPVWVDVPPGVPPRMTAKRMQAAWAMRTQTGLTQTIPIQTSAAPTLLPPGVLSSQVETPGQAKAPASVCCEGSCGAARPGIPRPPSQPPPR